MLFQTSGYFDGSVIPQESPDLTGDLWNGVSGELSPVVQIKPFHSLQKSKTPKLIEILALNTGRPLAEIERDTDRDNFLTAQAAMEYGLIDKVIDKRV